MSKTVVTKSGRRLTEADIERLADQAERGFDLSTWKPRPGRPVATQDGDYDDAPGVTVIRV